MHCLIGKGLGDINRQPGRHLYRMIAWVIVAVAVAEQLLALSSNPPATVNRIGREVAEERLPQVTFTLQNRWDGWSRQVLPIRLADVKDGT
jgi:hypothetical protein